MAERQKRPDTGREVRCGSPAGSELAPTEAAAETRAQPGGAGEGKAAAPQRADSPQGGAPRPASSLKNVPLVRFLDTQTLSGFDCPVF